MSNARHIEAEAADWLMRVGDEPLSAADQQAFDAWLEASFAHKAAYWRLEEGWRRADRAKALGMGAPALPRRRALFDRLWKPVALAASLALVTWAGVSNMRDPIAASHGQQIATLVGGHKIVPLDDGSRIELNTATQIRAAVSGERREVWLEAGEAFFDVRHSETIPFVVHAGRKTVTVMGTKFSVRREGDKVTVAVLEGRVRVAEAASPSTSATLVSAGSIAVTEPRSTLVTDDTSAAIQSELAWRDGQLVFRNDTLAEVAAEFNRYNRRKIHVTGQAAQLKIGGSFKASNIDGFSRLLRDAYGLNITATDQEVRVTE